MTIAEIVKNQDKIKEQKKSAIKNSDIVSFAVIKADNDTTKADEDIEGVTVIYPVINTTNYIDSHRDVHAKGIWDESLSAGNPVFYVADHELKVRSVIAYPANVKPEVRTMTWKSLGRDYKGSTQALVFAIALDGGEPTWFKRALKSGQLQNSVRMQYVDLVLCVNNPDYKSEYANWKKYRKEVANGDVADEAGYFWYITKANIHKEGSAVLFGSNDATPVLNEIKIEEKVEHKFKIKTLFV